MGHFQPIQPHMSHIVGSGWGSDGGSHNNRKVWNRTDGAPSQRWSRQPHEQQTRTIEIIRDINLGA